MEFGSCVPFDWEHRAASRSPIRANHRALTLGGYATRFNKVHPYNGAFDVFLPGAFAKSLLGGNEIRFLENHDEGKCLAVTGAHLKLWADTVGLSFKVRLPETVAAERIFENVKSHKTLAMSVGYEPTEVEEKIVADERVRLIRAARLNEVSIVHTGAVKEAFIQQLPPDDQFDEPFMLTKCAADCSAALARFGECLARTKELVLKH